MTDFEEVIKKADLAREQRVLYDKGVDSKNNRKVLSKMELKDGIMKKR